MIERESQIHIKASTTREPFLKDLVKMVMDAEENHPEVAFILEVEFTDKEV